MISWVKKAILILLLGVVCGCDRSPNNADPLPLWNDGPVKRQIISFVETVTDASSVDYVPPEERIATFDNDGTLWLEKPLYFQVAFLFDRIKQAAKEQPEVANKQPYKAIVEDDREYLQQAGYKELFGPLIHINAQYSSEEMQQDASRWLAEAFHPRFDVPYIWLTYAPMVEFVNYLKANDFQVFICSGGGIDFIRGISQELYGVPVDQVIGTSLKYSYESDGDKMVLKRLPELESLNDHAEKAANIQLHIGRPPILAVGNSDGDIEMLRFSESSSRPSLQLLLHHDDAERDYDYDKGTEKALEVAEQRGWNRISVKNDFRTVFQEPFSSQKEKGR